MSKRCQLYDEQGRPLPDATETKESILGKGLLHGAAHVWIWRNGVNGIEILLQKRSANMPTWPNCYDISAAGHIDLGEAPLTTALRETSEEIGLTITESELRCIGVQRAYMIAPSGAIENEFQWLYTLELTKDADFTLQQSEVSSLEWKPIDQFTQEVESDSEHYVGHGSLYYSTVIAAINQQNQK